jgi:hypothetical protein
MLGRVGKEVYASAGGSIREGGSEEAIWIIHL